MKLYTVGSDLHRYAFGVIPVIRLSQEMLNRAAKDRIISPEEEEMLEGFRERFVISSEEHKKIWNELER